MAARLERLISIETKEYQIWSPLWKRSIDPIHKWQLFYLCSTIVQISLPSLTLEQEFFSVEHMATRPDRLICTRTKEKLIGSHPWIASMSRRKERLITLPSALSFPSSKWYLTWAFTRDSEGTWHEEKAVSSPNLTRVFCHLFCFTSKEISDHLRWLILVSNFLVNVTGLKCEGGFHMDPAIVKWLPPHG